jgi:hypothetical protein
MGQEAGFALGDALTAGLGEWKSSLARKFQERQAQNALEMARRKDDTDRMLALVRAEAQTHAADTSAGARRYAAEAGYAGRTEAADRTAGAREYASENSAGARRYAADQGLAGRRYAADTGLKGANVRAGATRDAARTSAGGRVDAANIAAGARDRASAQSLYGTLFRPRPNVVDPLRPEGGGDINLKPDVGTWMKSQGLAPDVKPVGMQPAAAAGAPAAAPKTGAAPKPEHLATAADYVKKIRDANAKGDLEGAAALKKEAAKFLSSMQAAPAGTPDDDQDDGGFDDGTDDDEDDYDDEA